jgi:hypothetical protein
MVKWKIKSPGDFLIAVKKNYRLQKYTPNPSTVRLLENLYPGVEWSRVDFYTGLPWFTPTVAPYVTAQALPQFYSFGRFRIYLSHFDESRAQCIADIVHEAFHIMQAMYFNRGYGIGFFRGFMFYYIAYFLKYGYRSNPFEIPAYNQEYRFLDYCERHNIAGILPAVKPDAFVAINAEKSLVFPKYDFQYRDNWLYLLASFLICAIVTVLKPFADLLLFFVLLLVPRAKDAGLKQKATNPRSGDKIVHNDVKM